MADKTCTCGHPAWKHHGDGYMAGGPVDWGPCQDRGCPCNAFVWQPPAPSETEVLRAFLLGVARLDPRRLEPEYDGYGTVCYYCERDAGYGENIRHDESWHDSSCLWRRIREDLRARGIVIEQEDGDQK